MAIMTVDDSASLRQMVNFTLSDAGYDVMEAVDGADALRKLDGGGINMLIVDINMPNMGGLELIRKLREAPAFRYIPIVVLTTESSPEKRQAATAAGATGWIVKPFSPDALIEVVNRVLR